MAEPNKSGHIRRTASDNDVVYWPGPMLYRGHTIDDRKEVDDDGVMRGRWLLDKSVATDGSLSDLCKKLGFNEETHQIGFDLEDWGCKFRTPFA